MSLNREQEFMIGDGKGLATQAELDAEIAERKSSISDTSKDLQANIDKEIRDRQAAITSEANTRSTADTKLQNNIDKEVSDRKDAINKEETARGNADTTLQQNIDKEVADRKTAIQGEQTARSTAITNEQNARSTADTTLQQNIDKEVSDRKTAITNEQTARSGADTTLQQNIDKEVSDRKTAISAEQTARSEAISAEATSRTLADADLLSKINTKTRDFVFNLDGIKSFFGRPFPKIVFWGDGITAGSGASSPFSSFANLLADTLQLTRGVMYGRGYSAPDQDGSSTGTWNIETKGVNKRRMVGTTPATRTVFSHPFASRTIDILYSKEPDGGDFDVTYTSGTVITSGSCTGATSYGNKLTITMDMRVPFMIKPKGKTYIEGFIYRGYGGAADGPLVHNVSDGTFSAESFTDAEIDAAIKSFTPNLTCIGHIVNDVPLQTPTAFKAKIEKAIQAGKASGDVLLYIPCRGRLEVEGAPRTQTFDVYKQQMYDLANQYNCALIDFDKYMGGYTVAKNNGLLADDTNPNQSGHDLMASIMIMLLVSNALPQKQYKIKHVTTTGNYNDLLIQFPGVVGRLRLMNELHLHTILRGFSEAEDDESHLRINKLKVVGDGTKEYAVIDETGIKVGTVAAAAASNGAIFVDSDGKLKYKDGTGTVKAITLT